MEKKPFTLLHFDQTNSKKKVAKKLALLEKKWLLHLENDDYALVYFDSGKDHAAFTFTYADYDLDFALDLIVDTIILDFDGAGLPENIRIKASELIGRIIESLRFQYKHKYWSFSHYYLDNIKRYEERKNLDYPAQFHDEWKRIANLAKMESMDDADRLFMQVEDIHDLELNIVGDDGKVLCDYLQAMKLIRYRMVHENQWILEFLEPLDELGNINRKIVFAREVAYFGYNIWVDYPED